MVANFLTKGFCIACAVQAVNKATDTIFQHNNEERDSSVITLVTTTANSVVSAGVVQEEEQVIYGIGLPRTGSHSLAEALKLLEFRGSNSCMLTKSKVSHNVQQRYPYDDEKFLPGDSETSRGRFEVDNSMFRRYEALLNANPNAKFILCTRDNAEWKKSVKRWDSAHANSPWMYDLLSTDEYLAEVRDFFKRRNKLEQLLVLDVFAMTDETLWRKLVEFMDIKPGGFVSQYPITAVFNKTAFLARKLVFPRTVIDVDGTVSKHSDSFGGRTTASSAGELSYEKTNEDDDKYRDNNVCVEADPGVVKQATSYVSLGDEPRVEV